MSNESKYEINALLPFHVDAAAPDKLWYEVKKSAPYLTEWGIEKLRDGLDGFVQTVILERNYSCKDHRNLHSNFYSKRFREGAANCHRLHFFSRANLQLNELLANSEAYQGDYIGFSVIRPVSPRCLGRTVIDPSKVGKGLKDGCFVLRTRFHAQINGAVFEVLGYPYTSQDGDATVCAHSALWGVCRFLSQRYTSYRELHPYDLIRMTESSKGRVVPYRGMTYSDYCHILTDFGTFPVCRMLQRPGTPGFDKEVFKDLYTYVESGFPVLASVRTPGGMGHVVTLMGHTIDYKKDPGVTTGFLDSSHFLKQFVAVDDNCFPYQLLGYDGDIEGYGEVYGHNGKMLGIEDITTMTCPLPEKIFLRAEKAREKAMAYCNAISSNLKLIGKEPFVTRLFVTTGASFKKRKLAQSKSKNYGPDKAATFVLDLHLPHFIWVMEISPIDLYKNELCNAEIVLDATAGAGDDGVIYIRIGNQIFFDAKFNRLADGRVEFPQYMHNLGEKEFS